MPSNQQILTKFAQFSNTVVGVVAELEAKLASVVNEKEKQAEAKKDLLEKAAKALYEADFLTDYEERAKFVKRASMDPDFLLKMIIKVSEASDVSSFGKVAKIAPRNPNVDNDPIVARALGTYYNSAAGYSLLDE